MRIVSETLSILFVMFFLFSFKGISQEKDSIIDLNDEELKIGVKTICVFPTEKMPIFPGGEQKLYEYLVKRVVYPDSAKNNGIKGKVFVQFVVEKDGSIADVTVPRGIGYGCDESAMKAISEMPNWIPGEQRGKKVRVKYTIPINFGLH